MVKLRKKRSSSKLFISVSIPFDLVIEILLRLPTKSIARFRCVSKLWDSTLRSPNFTESFFTISSSRPKLFFTCLENCSKETFFFSSPQPQISSHIAVNFPPMSFPSNCPSNICRPFRGLVCGLARKLYWGRLRTRGCVPLILNPSTRQYLTLPTVKTKIRKSCLGYDPIDKQFKVLCIAYSRDNKCEVLTLGTGKKLSWRKIRCDIPHYPVAVDSSRHGYYVYDEICISGVCYYFARIYGDEESLVIVCFDIRSEKFKSIRTAQGMRKNFVRKVDSTLVNYKGKLAKIQLNIVGGICTGIQLWVLKDAEKHDWSSYIYAWPSPWNDIVKETKLRCVGTTATGEIVLSPKEISDSFYLVYYNPERNTI